MFTVVELYTEKKKSCVAALTLEVVVTVLIVSSTFYIYYIYCTSSNIYCTSSNIYCKVKLLCVGISAVLHKLIFFFSCI